MKIVRMKHRARMAPTRAHPVSFITLHRQNVQGLLHYLRSAGFTVKAAICHPSEIIIVSKLNEAKRLGLGLSESCVSQLLEAAIAAA